MATAAGSRAALILVAALAGCGEDAPVAGNAAAPAAGGYVDRVRALSDDQRDAVLFRAIRDAGRACQRVTASSPAAAVNGNPAWTAICDGRIPWIVSIDPAGTATVIGKAEPTG